MSLFAAISRGVVTLLSPERSPVPEDTEWADVSGAQPAPVPGWRAAPAPGGWFFAPPVPASVSNFQARAVLLSMPSPSGTAGRTLFADVDDALKAEGGVALQAWEYANDVDRDGALVNSLGAKLGMASAQIDQLFIAASGIVA